MLSAANVISDKEKEQRARLLTPLSLEENPFHDARMRSRARDGKRSTAGLFINIFCEHESQGTLAMIFSGALPMPGHISPAHFDKQESRLKWMVQCEKDLFIRNRIQNYIDEEKLSAALASVSDDYVEKLIYLVRLVHTSCLYLHIDKTLAATELEDIKAALNPAFDKILELNKNFQQTGIAPSNSNYMEKYEKDRRNYQVISGMVTQRVNLQLSQQKKFFKPMSFELEPLYESEFATIYLNHLFLEVAASKLSGGDTVKEFYVEVFGDMERLMSYADLQSHGFMRQITGVTHERVECTPEIMEDLFFTNVGKIYEDLASKQTYSEKLKFLTYLFISAYTIYCRIFEVIGQRPPEKNVKIRKTKINAEVEKLITIYNQTQVEPVYQEVKPSTSPVTTVKVEKTVKATQPSKPESPPKVPENSGNSGNSGDTKPQNSKGPSTPLAPPKIPSPALYIPRITPLSLFEKSYSELKRAADKLDERQKLLIEECGKLQHKLERTCKEDTESRITKEHKSRVENFKTRIEKEVVAEKVAIFAAIKALDYQDESKLTAAKVELSKIQTRIAELLALQENLSRGMQQEFDTLTHILPKKTANQLAAEKLSLEKEIARQNKLRLAEEEKRKNAEKKAKVSRPKLPPTQPIPQLLARSQPPQRKPEFKTIATAPREEKKSVRIQHLNQACINLILIHKMLAMYQQELPGEIIRYALLYNIFRCFQSLVNYQACGGNKQAINPGEIKELRNMMIHHGASQTDLKEIINFADSIKGKLSNTIANMKIKREYLISPEINFFERKELLEFSSHASHEQLIIEDTNLYKKLQTFHALRDNNDDKAQVFRLVFEEYLPKIRSILARLAKENPPEKIIEPAIFLENYLFLLQALRILISMCGEVSDYFKEDYSWTGMYTFLKICRQEVRNPVAHNLDDNFDPLDFYFKTQGLLNKLKENEFLNMIGGLPKSTSNSSHSATFFQPARSALDVQYDKPPTSATCVIPGQR